MLTPQTQDDCSFGLMNLNISLLEILWIVVVQQEYMN